MANVDKTRLLLNANEKKVRSVVATRVQLADFSGTDNLQLFVLPANCLITAARVVVATAAQASTTLKIGTSAGGNDLGNALALSAAGVVGGALTNGVDTGTGASVWIVPNQAPTAGDIDVVVEFIEYRRTNGELLNFNA